MIFFPVSLLRVQDSSKGQLLEALGNQTQEVGGGRGAEDECAVLNVQFQMCCR